MGVGRDANCHAWPTKLEAEDLLLVDSHYYVRTNEICNHLIKLHEANRASDIFRGFVVLSYTEDKNTL